jgi:hypothetical protein
MEPEPTTRAERRRAYAEKIEEAERMARKALDEATRQHWLQIADSWRVLSEQSS